jgi:hypothetical protein
MSTLREKLKKAGFGGLAIVTLLPIIRERAHEYKLHHARYEAEQVKP